MWTRLQDYKTIDKNKPTGRLSINNCKVDWYTQHAYPEWQEKSKKLLVEQITTQHTQKWA